MNSEHGSATEETVKAPAEGLLLLFMGL